MLVRVVICHLSVILLWNVHSLKVIVPVEQCISDSDEVSSINFLRVFYHVCAAHEMGTTKKQLLLLV